jgi:segregation and condensation protein B
VSEEKANGAADDDREEALAPGGEPAEPADESEDEDELDLSKVALPRGAGGDAGAGDKPPSAETGEPAQAVEESPRKPLLPDGDAARRSIIEAVLFVSPEPVRPAQFARNLGVDAAEARRLIRELADEYEKSGRAFRVVEVAGGFQVLTREEFAPYLAEFDRERSSGRLSPAALETLAIVAYRQPITRAEIEKIRGVGCGPILRSLMEKGLVRIAGRAEALGSPLLYATTPRFLEHFGLNSLKDLPRSSELRAG